MTKADRSIDELSMSVASMVLLDRMGIATLEQLCAVTADDLLEWQGATPMNLAEIRAALAYEGLSLRDAIQLDPFTHPTLEELYVSGDPLSEDCARALARSRFPALRRLVLSPSSERGVSSFEPFVEIIGALDAPRLEEAHFSISDVSVLAIAIPRCAAAGLKRVTLSPRLPMKKSSSTRSDPCACPRASRWGYPSPPLARGASHGRPPLASPGFATPLSGPGLSAGRA